MKKVISILLITCMLFSVTGCFAKNDMKPVSTPAEKIFSIDSYNLQITADSTFYDKTGGNFDLQITNDGSYISVMAYKYIDLPNDLKPADVFDMQNDDIFSRRDNVALIEDVKKETLSKSQVTYSLYSAEKDGTKNYYATYLVDFPEKERFAWVLITGMPSYLDSNREYLHSIVCSLATTD